MVNCPICEKISVGKPHAIILAVILIAVTVAVSIAVAAAWMGVLSFSLLSGPNSQTVVIPSFYGANYAVWQVGSYPSFQSPISQSSMIKLPANMTIDTTIWNNGTVLAVKVFYYQLPQASSLFEYLGKKDFVVVVEKRT